jgi:hypothetical protein
LFILLVVVSLFYLLRVSCRLRTVILPLAKGELDTEPRISAQLKASFWRMCEQRYSFLPLYDGVVVVSTVLLRVSSLEISRIQTDY